jgi:alpha-tubulin suppressor-like RCC1 family protein
VPRRSSLFIALGLSFLVLGTGRAGATPVVAAAPPAEATLVGISQVGAGGEHSCAVLSNGRARCWGSNVFFQLGTGDNESTRRAVPVVSGSGGSQQTGVVQLSAGYRHTCARLANRQVLCWGNNDFGELGNGFEEDSPRPVAVRNASGSAPLTNAVQVSTHGEHSCALLTTRQVRCWGRNNHGQLGDGTTTDRRRPVVVENANGTGPLVNVTQIATGYATTCVRLTSGQTTCWGWNASGQVGDGTTTDRRRPVLVDNAGGTRPLSGVAQIDAGYDSTCAVLTGGQVRCWGENEFGQLGDDTVTDHRRPRPVTNRTATGPLGGATSITVGDRLACVRVTGGQARCWGYGGSGQTGNGTPANIVDRPVVVRSRVGNRPLSGITQLATASQSVCARLSSGQARCWGRGDQGNLGDGHTRHRSLPVRVVT